MMVIHVMTLASNCKRHNTLTVIFILGYTDDVRDFMLRAKDMEMLQGYAWIGVDILG